MDTKNLIINNEYIEGEMGVIEILSPWDRQVMGKVASASKDQALKAIMSANNAFLKWRETGISERVEIIKKAIDLLRQDKGLLSRSLHLEIGKFESEAESEIERSIEYMELMISAVKHWNGALYRGDIYEKYPRNKKTGLYSRVPLGLVLAISPFNYPINLSITKVIPAILAGNTVILKSATQGSYTSYLFYEYLIKAGLPQGVLNVLSGTSSEIGDLLVSDPLIKLIAFTGSTVVGNHIKKISNDIPLLMELGGKDVGIVTPNANMAWAVSEIANGAFSYAGQRCTAQKLALIDFSIIENFSSRIVETVKSMEINPMIDEKSARYVMELYEDAIARGATALLTPTIEGNRLSAGIVSDVTPEMRIFKEEQFGPLLPIMGFKEIRDAVNYANSSQFGLQGSIYSQDIDEAFMIADGLEVGTVQINAKTDRSPDNFPFGGTKDSGQFMQGSIETLDLMTRGKLVVLNRKV